MATCLRGRRRSDVNQLPHATLRSTADRRAWEHMMQATTSRRVVLMAGTLTVGSAARAQSPSPFVGSWHGQVPGFGDAQIVVVAVRPNGHVDGKMVFQNQAFAFGEKLDIAKGINHGVVRGSTLRIETSLGGTYLLNMVGGQLTGEYVRGNTYKVPVTFQKPTVAPRAPRSGSNFVGAIPVRESNDRPSRTDA
jgi:hypothetical protein